MSERERVSDFKPSDIPGLSRHFSAADLDLPDGAAVPARRDDRPGAGTGRRRRDLRGWSIRTAPPAMGWGLPDG